MPVENIGYPLPFSHSRYLCGIGDRCYIPSERRCGTIREFAFTQRPLVLVAINKPPPANPPLQHEFYPLDEIVVLPPHLRAANVEKIETWLADGDPSRPCDMED